MKVGRRKKMANVENVKMANVDELRRSWEAPAALERGLEIRIRLDKALFEGALLRWAERCIHGSVDDERCRLVWLQLLHLRFGMRVGGFGLGFGCMVYFLH